ncbi:ABC transporter substrate-binding protein [Kibdelosporangium philippinense]|uniref:ABC transporter substrate-binding protein n=1 Tax=Kibdelosporangium philippinense TaxID=211113 RepID=A0ABS8ZIY4_9PSEU|nr:ABC transporter substrate-binding protein [Kibdelosporangium philippinense]MCE7006910.1 ABC transporter substrate-binding protein [Kibdelosporangium philippinense]
MPRLVRRLSAVALAAGLLMLTGCGLLGGASPDASPNDKVEKSTIRVGRLALVDAIPLHIAIDKGYFEAEGLKIELSTMGRGSDGVDKLAAGELDVGLTSYPQPLIAHTKGVAKLKVVADAVETTPDLILAVVKENGPITDARQLAGKKIAISSKRGISELVMTDQLTSMGVDPKAVSFISMPITDMPAALGRGDVAAAIIAQPPLEEAKQQGAMKLLDPFTGPTVSFPWSGWFATEQFVRDNPRTVDAFRRALSRGVTNVSDRNVLEQSAVKNLGTKEGTARMMTVPRFPSTTDPVRLQRVADLLAKYGEIPKVDSPQGVRAELDMRSMVLPPLPPALWATTTTGN